eukprot:GEMP01014838.1.p1 GENE.GEMP01014838.1~~GEMP01014838.1.p1  ORF type:complete len:501 (+),score=103.26 GEMP01014838.1:45-1547(+)
MDPTKKNNVDGYLSDVESIVKTPPSCSLEEKGANAFSGTFNLANAALGAGLLTFPKSFASTGIAGGLWTQMILTLLLFIGLIVLAQAAKFTSSDSLALICSRMFGKFSEYITVAMVIAYCWCGCVAYLTIIGAQLEVFGRILENVDDGCPVKWYLDPKVTTTLIGTIIVYPLASLRDMSALSWSSCVAIAACWYITFFVLISYISATPESLGQTDNCVVEDTFWGVASAVPAMCFGYQCHIASVPNYASLSGKAKASYAYVALGGCMLCFVIYSTVGVAGASTFGDCTASQSLILDNYPRDNMFANIGRLVVSVAVATSYPIVAFCGRQESSNMFDALCLKQGWTFSDRNIFFGTPNARLFWFGSMWYFSTLIFTLCVPDIKWVINITGVPSGLTMFVYPGFIAMKLANLYHLESIDAALANLPNQVAECARESWMLSMRARVMYWLNSAERRAVWWGGLMLVLVGVFVCINCIGVFWNQVVVSLNEIPITLEQIHCATG